MEILLVCGYRGTGKDTLCQQFNGIRNFNWKVLGREHRSDKFIIKPVRRIAYADVLKKTVNKMLGIKEDINTEPLKEMSLLQIEKIIGYELSKEHNKDKTLREYYIQYATEKRKQDEDYWCSRVELGTELKDHVMITDWRYKNEYEYVRKYWKYDTMTTIRVFRKDVCIPEHESEHELDEIQTEYVLIPEKGYEEEYNKLIEIFPQYKGYVEKEWMM